MNASLCLLVETTLYQKRPGTNADGTARLSRIVTSTAGCGQTTYHGRRTGNESSPGGVTQLSKRDSFLVALFAPGIIGQSHLPNVSRVVILHRVDEHEIALTDIANATQDRVVFCRQRNQLIFPP